MFPQHMPFRKHFDGISVLSKSLGEVRKERAVYQKATATVASASARVITPMTGNLLARLHVS